MRDKSKPVKTVQRILLLGAMVLGGCHTAHDVAVTSFRVIDAPANYVRQRLDHSNTVVTRTTTTTVASDSVTPGRTLPVAPNTREPQRPPVAQTQPRPVATPQATPRSTIIAKPKPSPGPPRSVTAASTEYPTAKIVPGKPGYVFSPYDPNGGYVDVNGFPSGSKVKDPYSGKVFLVP
jgi:hypothetical protein